MISAVAERFTPTLAVIACIAITASAARAQHLGDSRVALASPSGTRHLRASVTIVSNPGRPSQDRKALTRVLSAAIGLGVGAVGGAYLGDASMECGDDCFIPMGALIGGLVGGITGASVGAALPSFSSPCSFGARFARGVAGSLVGGLIAGVFVRTQGSDGYPLVFTFVTGISFGAALFQGSC
jgi:hypothetical protein